MSSTFVRPTPTLPGPWKAVVFDMDGLLVHTERQWLEAKVELCRRHGHELNRADRAAVFGLADGESAEYFTRVFGFGEDRVEEIRQEYLEIVGGLIDSGVVVTAGATELIERLRTQVPIGLASNTRRSLVDRVLAQTPFGDSFVAITTGDEVPPKPAPDVYRTACQRLDADPASAVAIEDSPTGVKAARAAGLTCIGVPSDPDHPLTEADHQATALTDLL
jgi:HAD superfamily hydrolase (TIGR01509 family)